MASSRFTVTLVRSKRNDWLTAVGAIVSGTALTQLLVINDFSELDESFIQLGWQGFAVVLAICAIDFYIDAMGWLLALQSLLLTAFCW